MLRPPLLLAILISMAVPAWLLSVAAPGGGARKVRAAAAAAKEAAPAAPGGRVKAGHPSNAGPVDAEIKVDIPAVGPLAVDVALKTFKLAPGFRIEPVAVEPMVEDPVAMAFDERGRIWVVEMRGYMHDIWAAGEDQPIGRVRVLEDADGDGKMDKATIFLDGLVMPRAVLPLRGGALVGEPPELAHWVDTDGDGRADRKTVVATNFGSRGGQPEHMANTPVYALDNWVYSAGYGSRFKFQRGKWVTEAAASRGQWGLSQDDYGRLYVSTNSDLGRADLLPAHYFSRNPFQPGNGAVNVGIVSNQVVWPGHPTPGVNRGYSKGVLRDDGTLRTATAAGGAGVYRGDLFPEEFRGNLFTPEPSGNLVKRLVVTESRGKLGAKGAYEDFDFLTSTDERFRPVMATTGPDGALYVVDLYRGVLQHRAFLTHYLVKNIEKRNLEKPIHYGRIYRMVPEGKTPAAAKLPADGAGLVAALAHPNGWVRDTAQRLLVEKNDKSTFAPLAELAAGGPTPLSRLHALWALEGLGRLEPQTALAALADADSKVRAAAVRLVEPLLVPATRAQFLPPVMKLAAADASPDVQLQLALTLSAVADPAAEEAVAGLLTNTSADPSLMRDAVLSGLRGRELEFAERLLARPEWSSQSGDRAETLVALARCVIAERRPSRVARLLEIAARQESGSWRQKALLTGMAPKPGKTTRLVYLDARPEELEALLAGGEAPMRSLARQVEAGLAWPGKPGVPPPPVVVPLTPEQQAWFEKGKAVYTLTCAACHQPTGLGVEGLAPPLVDSEWVLGSERKLARIVLHGLTGPITVSGAHYNLEMPALSTLTDEEIAATLTYVRREWEHGASPVGPDVVKRVRDESAGRTDLWTAKELQAVR